MSDSGLMSDSCLIHCQFEDFYIVLLEKKSCRWLDCEKNWISLQGKFSCFIYIGISLELIGLYWSYKLAANFHVFIMVLWKKFNALNKQYMYVFVKHCQFAWVKVVNTLPIWGFLYHFIRKKNPAVDWTVKKIGSKCKGNFPASFDWASALYFQNSFQIQKIWEEMI